MRGGRRIMDYKDIAFEIANNDKFEGIGIGIEVIESIVKEAEMLKYGDLIKEAHQEAHECNSSQEVHTWIDWFAKKLDANVLEGEQYE